MSIKILDIDDVNSNLYETLIEKERKVQKVERMIEKVKKIRKEIAQKREDLKKDFELKTKLVMHQRIEILNELEKVTKRMNILEQKNENYNRFKKAARK